MAAAALGPQAEAEGWRRLLRAVTRLQACVRGYLLRKRFGSLQAEYEEVVLEIEGDLSQLEWRGRFLPRPVFIPQLCAAGRVEASAAPCFKPEHQQGEQCSALQEAAARDEASADKPQEELELSEPEQDGGCSSVKLTAQLQSKPELSSAGEGGAVSPPDLRAEADKGTEKGCSAPAESKDWQDSSSISSVWDSSEEAEPLGASLETTLEDMQELPQTRSGLESYRSHLLMELLWLQQAIASRENYLVLKQKLEGDS